MEWQPLELQDRLRLRSRLLVSLALGIVFAAGAVGGAFQLMDPDVEQKYLWMGGVILCLAILFGFLRVVLRLGKDLRFGKKQLLSGKVSMIKPAKRRMYIKVGDHGLHLPPAYVQGVEKGQQISIHMSKSKVVLGIEV